MTDRPVRVARIIARLNVGGPARHVVWLTAALNDENFRSDLITGVVPDGEQDMSGFAAKHGVEPLILPAMSREISVADLVVIWHLFRAFRRMRPDIVHTHTAKAGTVGRAAGFLYRWLTLGSIIGRPRQCRFVHTFHGHIFHSYYGPLKTAIFVRIERLLARMTDRILVLSEQQLDEIHRTFGIGRREQFRIVPLGLDLDAVRAPRNGASLRSRLGLEPEAFVVGIIGRLTAIKNHSMFVDAADLLPDHIDGRPLRLAIFGEGSERAAIERLIRVRGLDARVLLAGQHEAAEIYSAIDLAALTSLNEGTPLTIIEALANGVPTVSTAVGGVVDVLGAVARVVERAGVRYEVRERGVTVATKDVDSFAAAIRDLAASRDDIRRLGNDGAMYVESGYSKDRLVTDIIALYRELTQSPIPSSGQRRS